MNTKHYYLLLMLALVANVHSAEAQQPNVLHAFTALINGTNSDGAVPNGGLISSKSIFNGTSENWLYGTTAKGGKWGGGTIFAVRTDGNGFTTVHSFNPVTDGGVPNGGLTLSADGFTIYGTTKSTNALESGTAFSIDISTGTLLTLHTFPGIGITSSDGIAPNGGLLLSGNTLYGTTPQGYDCGSPLNFANNSGIIFAIDTDGSNYTIFWPMCAGDSHVPNCNLIQSGDTLYGTSVDGGLAYGTLFGINTNVDSAAHFAYRFIDFPSTTPNPRGNLISDGTNICGTGPGYVFAWRIAPIYAVGQVASITNTFPFGINNPQLGFSATNSYNLCGTDNSAGGAGVVFTINIDGTCFSSLYNFDGGIAGDSPNGGLILWGNDMYGTAAGGGNSGNGTVFVITQSMPPAIQQNHPGVIIEPLGAHNTNLSVTAIGAVPLYYQWYLNGNLINGATASWFQYIGGTRTTDGGTLINTNQYGSYSVVVSNAFGTITSSNMWVVSPPVIADVSGYYAGYPDYVIYNSQYSVFGFTNILWVTAYAPAQYPGDTVQYQWLYSANGVGDFSNIPSATNSHLSATTAGYYKVLVSNEFGSVTNQEVTVPAQALRILPTVNVLEFNLDGGLQYLQEFGYWPNVPMTYTILAGAAAGSPNYSVQDQVEDLEGNGFAYSAATINPTGTWDSVNSIVKFKPFLDGHPRTLTYQIIPSSNSTDTMLLDGTISINGVNYTVVGDDAMSLLPLHPADNGGESALPIDGIININEMTAYASAWWVAPGAYWPVSPSPIPQSYVTSAIGIWQQGEHYAYNQLLGGTPPAGWVPTNAPAGTTQQTLVAKASSFPGGKAGGITPLDQTSSTAVCSMPTEYTDNVSFTVTVTVTPASNVSVYAVEDQIPSGWAASNFSGGGVFDSINNKVKWGPFFDNSPQTLTYQTTPSSTSTGVVTFSGTASFDGVGILLSGVRQVAPLGDVKQTRIIGLNSNLVFGNVMTGTTVVATLTVADTGNTALTISSISCPSGFSGAWSGTIPSGGSQPVTVTFAPIAVTVYSGMIAVNSDANGGTSTIMASGTGVATAPITATITVLASPTEGGTVSGGGTYRVSSSQKISATANSGWAFTGWSDGNTQNPRTITVPVNGVTYTANFTVTPCTVTLGTTSIDLAAKGGSKTVKVKPSSSDCSWIAVSNDSFITITESATTLVKFSVPGNTNTVPLTGTMTIAGQTFTVNQAAGGCTYKLSPKAGKIKATGGSATIRVKPNFSDCAWTAVSNDPFITITAGASGLGKGTVSYTVAANTNTMVLTGSLTIGGQIFTVTQSGAK